MRSHLPGTFLLAGASLALGSILSAQTMSGNYTINPSGTGSRNFQSFTAAAAALSSNGVSGPVVLASTMSATFTESFTINAISGLSATNTVTFKSTITTVPSLRTKLVGGAGDIVTIAASVSHIVFDGLNFVSATNGAAIKGNIGNTNIEVENCDFGQGITGYGGGRGVIHVDGKNTAAAWRIHHNVFDLPAINYGMYMSQIKLSHVYNNEFKLNGTLYGQYWINLNNSLNKIYNNIFTGTTRSSTGACAVNVAASNSNNDICHNTFAISTSGHAIRTFGTSSNFNKIYGNIFAVTGAGGGIYVNTGNLTHFKSDWNLFFIQSNKIGTYGGAAHLSLSAWQNATAATGQGMADKNSLVGDPKFKSTTDFHLTATSPGIGKAGAFAGRIIPTDDFDGLIRGTKRDMGALERSGWEFYGKGCPGTGGKVPALGFSGNIEPGDTVTIQLSNALPSSSAALAIGVAQISVGFGGGCDLLVNPLVILWLGTSASGSLSLPVAIPSSTAMTGAKAYLQWGVKDPAAAGIQAAMSNASTAKL